MVVETKTNTAVGKPPAVFMFLFLSEIAPLAQRRSIDTKSELGFNQPYRNDYRSLSSTNAGVNNALETDKRLQVAVLFSR